MSNQQKNKVKALFIIPVSVTNGILSGISSVIAAYFFRPVWNKITKLWEKE